MRATGRIEKWNDDRGFGFIAPTGGGWKFPLDRKAVREDRWRIPETNMRLVVLAGGWPAI